LSTVNKIKTDNSLSVQDKEDEDYDDYNQQREKQWVDKQMSRFQMQMRHDHECHDYLYIEKVCQLVDGK